MSKKKKKKKKKKNVSISGKMYSDMCLSYMEKYKHPEEWKRVVINGESTKYAVSNYGRVMNTDMLNMPRVYINKGHYGVHLTLDDGQNRRMGTYRLVATMFIPIPQKYLDKGFTMKDLVVDHKRDGDEDNFDDNTVWNLQWLTNRENVSKAAKCGYREAFEPGFRPHLDQMILDGYDNDYIYDVCLNEYGYDKSEIKATLQVRRRRLGVTLKEHYENDKEFVKKIDKLLLKGLSNDEIVEKLNMPDDTRASRRLLQYRRSILKVPAETSKYFDKEKNEVLNKLISDGLTADQILNYFKLDTLEDKDVLKKIRCTIATRISQYKRKLASSTTIESIS